MSSLRSKYGITERVYRLMLSEQGGRCAVCGRKPATRRLHVDHCHLTGRVRGLLCYLCNHKLIAQHSNPALFRAAAEYLERDHDARDHVNDSEMKRYPVLRKRKEEPWRPKRRRKTKS